MNISQIEKNIKQLLPAITSGDCQHDTFIYELLLAYGHRKQSVTRLRTGERNLADDPNEVIWKRHLYFKHTSNAELYADIDNMRSKNVVLRHKLRFLIVTNFNKLLAVDTKTGDTLDIEFFDLHKHFDFFLPWAGMEKAVYQGENPADVKAAEKMAKLFDLIKTENFDEANQNDISKLHNLNIFLTRLLFCFFAEDTEIFSNNQFSHAIKSHTKANGGDLTDYLERLFVVLNTASNERDNLPEYLSSFPYVNGGLFSDKISLPTFSTKSRKMLIECGDELDWSDINPDIFGSMIQAVVHPDQRGGMGMHYTSVTNIMKVIEPLFLNDLYDEFEKIENNPKKLHLLQQHLSEIKIFDPACGSGNFLIIAYKELRNLEIEILKQLQDIESKKSGQISQPFSVIKLSQFYGIELDDFAHEVAILSLWLAEHQMNVEFKVEFGESAPSLPLRKSGNIVCGNAVRLDWKSICQTDSLVYILGNPPYKGARKQNKAQKDDLEYIYSGAKQYKDCDYVSCWFLKASDYISSNDASYGFVATSSITQGEQVSYIWSPILSNGQEIAFAHSPFKWTNNARDAAGVSCVIIGVRNKSDKKKVLFENSMILTVKNISPYITEAEDIFVTRRKQPLSSSLPKMVSGSMARDGGYLILSTAEKEDLLEKYPESKILIRPLYGTQEFLQGSQRFCLWIEDDFLVLAKSIPPILHRIENVYQFRNKSSAKTTRGYASIPHKFAQRAHKDTPHIIIPKVSTDRRLYMPIGFLDPDSIITDLAFGIYDSDPFVFGLLSSKMHVVWLKAVSGRLGTGIRYSSNITYNNFPVPNITDDTKNIITDLVFKLLQVRESHPSQSVSKLYDPDYMPQDLLAAHQALDVAVDNIYSTKEFDSDTDRLACLFSLYQKMIGDNNA